MQASSTLDPSRETLRAAKAAKKALKKERREALRRHSRAKALSAQAERDPSLLVAAAEAAEAARAAPLPARWTAIVSDAVRAEAARRAGTAVKTLLSHSNYDKKVAAEAADILLRAMGKGSQTREMFGAAAVEGYIKKKFAERALLVFTAAHIARRTLPWAAKALQSLSSSDSLVVSVGGGPGCCLFGWTLFEDLSASCGAAQLESWDFASEAWGLWVRSVNSVLLGTGTGGVCGTVQPPRLSGRQCDICKPLHEQPSLLRGTRSAALFIISYVLTETRGRWEGFVRALYDEACEGALFLLAEPTEWQCRRFLAVLGEERSEPPPRHAWLDARTTAAPPSVLLVEKPRGRCGVGANIPLEVVAHPRA